MGARRLKAPRNVCHECAEELLLWCDALNEGMERLALDPRVRDAMDFLCHNMGRKISLEDVGLSKWLVAVAPGALFVPRPG